MKDLTYIKVKEGKLWASDMVKPVILEPKYYNNHTLWKQAMEAFNQSFVEAADSQASAKLLMDWHNKGKIKLTTGLYFGEEGLHPVSGLQFEVKRQTKKDGDYDWFRKVAILSLKQEQECESSDTGKHRWGEYIEGAPRCYFCGEAFFSSDKQEQPSEEKKYTLIEISEKLKQGLSRYGCKSTVAGRWVLEDNIYHVLRELKD